MAVATAGGCCCCCLSFPHAQTFEPAQRGGAAFTAAISAGLVKPLCCANSASSPSSRRGLTDEEQRFPARWALSNVRPVAPRRKYYREGDGGRPNRMVAEVYRQQSLQQERGSFPRPPVIWWEKEFASAVQLIGRVGRDIEIKYLDSGRVMATTSLAVHKGSQRTWFTLEIWDELAEIAALHVAKGELILVAGKIVVDKRVKDDVRHTNIKVVVRDFCFVEPSSDRRQPYGKSNDEFTVRGSSSQSEAEVASMDSSQRSRNQQQLSSQPSQGAFAGFRGARGHGNNVAQLEALSPQTRAGASKWREAGKMIEQNRNPSHKVVGGIESRRQNTDRFKVELKRVGHIEANLTSSIRANDVLENREREPLSRQEEGQSSPVSEVGATGNSVRQDLRTEDLLSGQSTPASMKAGLNLIAQGRLQSRVNYGSRDWSRDTPQGSTQHHRADSTSETIAVLQNRLQRGVTIDSYEYVKVLQMCFKQKDLFAAKQLHACIIQSGMDKNLYVAGNLLNVYIKCGGLVDARRVFDQLEKKSVVDWTIMIAGYAKSDHAESALELFNQMRQESVEPDKITYLSILKACTTLLALKSGKEIHECIRQAGFESDVRVGTALLKMYTECGCIAEARLVFEKLTKRDVITWTVMIGGLAQHGCGHEAYRLFLQMRQEGFQPNAFTYTSILNSSASAGALEWVKEVHCHASKAGLESDLRVGNALVHMYAEIGNIDDAREVFDRMEKRDVVTWNVMIGGLALHGCGHEALELFSKMNADRVNPDGTSLMAVLSACCHAGLVDDGRKLFSAITQDYGIEPTVVHYTCMVDLLGRAGHLEEAKQFISDMPVEPDVVIWTALLGACRTYGNVEMGEVAANELFKLEPSKASTYVLLSNIYAAAGKWEKVSLVRSMMHKRGVRKEPGCSWIDVDNKTHEFVVGDKSHPEANAIYTELNKLTEKLKAEGYIPDTRLVLHDIGEEDKELALCSHSEKLAIAYGLLHIPEGEPIRVRKNLRVCPDCHTATKFISKVTGREIIARDANRFHHFKDGVCSCGDYW